MAATTAPAAIRRSSAATISPRARRALPPVSTIASRRDTVVGFALAGGGTNWSVATGSAAARATRSRPASTRATHSGPAYLAAALAYTNHWMSTDRFAFGDHLTAELQRAELRRPRRSGYRVGTPAGAITPYAALQAQSFHTPSYSETDVNGGGFALTYNARTATATRSELGARFDNAVLARSPLRCWRCADGSPGRTTG